MAFVTGIPLASLSALVAALSVPGARATILLIAVGVAHLALIGRRTRPLVSHAVVCAAFAAQTTVTGLFLVLPSVLVFPMSLYAVTAYGRRAVAPATGVLGSCLVAARFATDDSVRSANLGPNPWLLLALLLAIVAAAWSMGLVRRTQLAYAQISAERARDEERTRIAREMHDVIAHSLAVIVSQAKAGRYAPDHAADALSAIEGTGRAALTDVRGLLSVLRPDQSPQPTLRDLPALLDQVRSTGLEVNRTDQGAPRPLSAAAELAAYRLVQEGLTNTMKHGGTTVRAAVALDWGIDALTITIRDNGTAVPSTPGMGLSGMRERLSALGGSLTNGPAQDGYALQGRLPYPETS
ncbi:two-component sensor histidine kinase [Actinomadura coerulea]|nr:two-component sensor histidine kinase [Actinomadura coerulea]